MHMDNDYNLAIACITILLLLIGACLGILGRDAVTERKLEQRVKWEKWERANRSTRG
jgi:hypothetical protein